MTYHEFINAVLQALFPVLLAVITAAAGALAQKLHQYLNARFTTEQLGKAEAVSRYAVLFTEQVYRTAGGPAKLAAALAQAEALGRGVGISYSSEQWRTLVEQAVFTFNREWKQPSNGGTQSV